MLTVINRTATAITVLVPGRITIRADHGATAVTVDLKPAVAGDRAAAAAIAAAQVHDHPTRLRIKVESQPVLQTGAGSLSGVTISGGSVIAGNIGGVGNVGIVSGGDGRGRGLVDAVVTIPAERLVLLEHADGDAYIELTEVAR
ncbi:hypothetical protein AB0H58_32510 [Nocardia neocaledoniensis]|uniref:hypothetical protein n=1 Tax=Nocardia neocaledoniensis TaxID=236511 RepID=UPI0033E07200